ncbi:hypothetical protein CsSME_00000148 [Camellia sinensis var. sinensis]
MPRSFSGGGKSSSASSGSNIVKLAATILGLSSLSKNLANFHVKEPCSCEILEKEYEEVQFFRVQSHWEWLSVI